MNCPGFIYDIGMIACTAIDKRTMKADRMTLEPTKLHGRQKRHFDELKKEIAHCLDKELNMLAEERSERARRLGLSERLEQRRQQPSA